MKPTYEELEEKLKKISEKIDIDVLLENEEFTLETDGYVKGEDGRDLNLYFEQMEDFSMAFSETAPDWKTRCYRMGAALGCDFGDPEWLMPDQRNKLHIAENKLAAFQDVLMNVNKYIKTSMNGYLRTCSSGGMPKEIEDSVRVHIEAAIDYGYFQNTIAFAIHERVEDGSKEAH
jgi:hypothetical protein